MNSRQTALIALFLVQTGCSMIGGRSSQPSPDAPYLTPKLCGFRFDGRTNEARFSIDLGVGRPLPRGGIVEATFENPLDSTRPLVATQVVKGNEKELRLLSPPVKGIVKRDYAMTVRLFDPRDRTRPLVSLAENCSTPFAQSDMGVEYR